MPPQIALLISIFFIILMLRMDSRHQPDVSYSIWIPLIWVIICGSKLPSQWLNTESYSTQEMAYMEGSLFDRIFLSVLIIVGLYILFRRKIEWSRICRDNLWIFLFFLYCGISTLWSDFPLIAFKRWFKASGHFVMVLIVLTEVNPIEAVKAILKRCSYVLIPLSILFIKYYPKIGIGYEYWTGDTIFKGVTTSKNMLGNLCLVSGYFFLWSLIIAWGRKKETTDKKEVLINILFLVMIFWLLIKADSATSLLGLIIGFLIMIGLGLPIIKENVKYMGIYIIIVSLLFFALIFWDDNFLISSLVNHVGRNETFTGRTQLWKDLIRQTVNPLIGVGYDSFWLGERVKEIWSNYWWRPNQAHNGFVEIFINLGWVGLFLLIGVILHSYRNIHRVLMLDFDYGRFQVGFLLITLIYNVTEAAFKGLHLVWFVFILIAVYVPGLKELKMTTTAREYKVRYSNL